MTSPYQTSSHQTSSHQTSLSQTFPAHSTLLRSNSQRLIPGILGGLGPLAHIEFERCLLTQSTQRGASKDQDHPVWLLINAAATPDRTQSLTQNSKEAIGESTQETTTDCAPWLLHYSQRLESMGADFLVVTCNTAHAFYSRIQPQLQIPWVHMMQAVARSIVAQNQTQNKRQKQNQRIGIMATSGTLHTQLYKKSLAAVGLTPIYPEIDSDIQQQIMQSIYAPVWGIKSSGTNVSRQVKKTLHEAINWFQQQNADIVIAGCTELSVGLACLEQTSLPWVDPLEILADLTLSLAYGEAVLIPPTQKAASPNTSKISSVVQSPLQLPLQQSSDRPF